MNKMRSLTALSLTLLSLLLTGTSAMASALTLTFTTPFQTAASGDQLSFEATVNNTGTSPVFLTGDSATLGGAFLLDDTPFLINFPLFMNSAETYTGELFTVTVLPGTLAGLYSGVFQILGGSGDSSQDIVGSAEFNINVDSQPVPEPSSLILLLIGMCGVVGVFRRHGSLHHSAQG